MVSSIEYKGYRFSPFPEKGQDFDKSKHAHWKLHLSFDYNNPEHLEIVKNYLDSLKTEHKRLIYKIGKSDDDAKSATVYCGSSCAVNEVAKKIQQNLGNVLKPASGETLDTDTEIDGHVWGRFCMAGNNIQEIRDDTSFQPYGINGVPFLQKDDENLFLIQNQKGKGSREAKESLKKAYQKSFDLCSEFYSSYFTGQISFLDLMTERGFQ